MRAVLALVGFLAGACSKPPACARSTPSSIESQTVALIATDEEGVTRPLCAGVWVSASSVLTAYHCVDEEVYVATKQDVFLPADLNAIPRGRPAKVYASDEEHDLALLRVDTPQPHPVVQVRLPNLSLGDRLQTVGHPRGLWWSYSSGELAAVRKLPGVDTVLLQTTAPISPGNSGGGLFNAQGQLVGIVSRAMPAKMAQNVGLAVHVQYVDALLRRQGTNL